jgi:putative copper export protein
MREIMLILHFIGLAMGLGTGFAHAFMDKMISKMQKKEATKFRLQVMVLSNMGYVGILLLVISGIYLASPYWSTLFANPLLIIKLVLVMVLCFLLLFIGRGARKAYVENTEENLKKIEPMGKLTLIIGITIIILAVYIFH